MLNPPESEIDIRERRPLALAFVGDGVLELLVRARLVAHSRHNAGVLHKMAVEMVSAHAQSGYLPLIEPLLSEEEATVMRRGRNATKGNSAKNASDKEYRASTGLEALFGWLYLQNRLARVEELFEPVWQDWLARQDAQER